MRSSCSASRSDRAPRVRTASSTWARIRLPRLAGMGGVTPRKLLHGLDAERHRPQEDTLFLVERIVRQAGSDFGLPGIEPKADGGFVVGRYVADRPRSWM